MEIPPLDRDSELSLSRQIFEWFRDAALDGSLPAGESLPATRALARQTGVSRNTVCEAYELLAAEGYIECSAGTRARIAHGVALKVTVAAPLAAPLTGLHQGTLMRAPRPAPGGEPGGAGAAEISLSGARREKARSSDVPIEIDFRTGRPDLATIPRAQWSRALLLASESLEERDWLYGPGEGLPSLRAEIASYLFRARGMRVSPDAVFVTAGATHALHVAALILAPRGAAIAAEDPCHSGMIRTIRGVGLGVIPVEADESGMRTELLAPIDAVAAYVTPSHQFPLGGVLPASRRSELVRWARRRNAYIVEDDYDAEFRYSGPPIAPLWSLDPERTVYVGTFSKTLFPAVRIGYALVPHELRRAWTEARVHSDVQNPPFGQAALARLLADRTVDRHVARMRRLYARRRAVLLAALDSAFGSRARVLGDSAGLHLAVRLSGLRMDESLGKRARGRGIALVGVESHALVSGRWLDTFLAGYGHLDEAAIVRGIARLAQFFAEEGILPGN